MSKMHKFAIIENGTKYILEIKAIKVENAASFIWQNLPVSRLIDMPETALISATPMHPTLEYLGSEELTPA